MLPRTPATESLRQALREAYHASGLTNAEFARRAGLSEPMALRLHQDEETPKMEYVERGFKALGLKIKFEIVPILLAALLLAVPAVAGTPNCPVQVSIDLDTYNGAVHYENICLTLPAMYSNGLLSIEGVELGDGIFKDGFDG